MANETLPITSLVMLPMLSLTTPLVSVLISCGAWSASGSTKICSSAGAGSAGCS